jgi:hypothetical protein
VELPGGWPAWDPLAGLETEELTEVIAESVQTLRRQSRETSRDGHALTWQVLETVVDRLAEPRTLGRVVAGLRVLRRVEPTSSGTLSAEEVHSLASAIDSLGHTEHVQRELYQLTGLLDGLARDEAAARPDSTAHPPAGALCRPGLTVVATGGHRRRKELLIGLIFHRVLRELRERSGVGTDRAVILAGADWLDADSLDDLGRAARQAGTRLILFFEHLHGDAADLVGGADTATVLMRLGNGREAATAADFIGRGYRFVLNQVTTQYGRTFTQGRTESHGAQSSTGESTTAGMSFSGIRSTGGEIPFPIIDVTASGSRSQTSSRTATWQETANWSTASTTTDGTTMTRSYEYAIEPATIQALPATAFVLVEATGTGRRVVAGDCNPGIAQLERTAPVG